MAIAGLLWAGVLTLVKRNTPFEAVLFKTEYPGAGDRHVLFTPVLLADPSKVIGESVGADFGEISYRDCDGDGVNEAVIETRLWLDTGEYRASVRHVYKYVPDIGNGPGVKLISTQYLPENDPEWMRGETIVIKKEKFCESG